MPGLPPVQMRTGANDAGPKVAPVAPTLIVVVPADCKVSAPPPLLIVSVPLPDESKFVEALYVSDELTFSVDAVPVDPTNGIKYPVLPVVPVIVMVVEVPAGPVGPVTDAPVAPV